MRERERGMCARAQVGDKVEARDVKGHWYRSTVVALSYTGLQVSPAT